HQKHRGTPQTGPAPNTTPPHRTRPHPLTRPPRARKGASRNTQATPPGRSQTMHAAGNTAPQRQDRPARQAPTTPHTTPRITQPTRAPKHEEEVNMATSRTGTAKWLRIRRQAIKQAIENNIFNCPTCGVGLDYEHSRQPNSAEVDHIIPHSHGGEDSLANTQIVLRLCNQSKGNAAQRRKQTVPKRLEPQTGVPW